MKTKQQKSQQTDAQCSPVGGALQRAAIDEAPVTDIPPIVHEVLRSPGQPLDAETRAFFEPRFEYDFSQVRVHTDATAIESARAVNALAYTMGHDIVFGEGQYTQAINDKYSLLAHELTHVTQKPSGSSPCLQRQVASSAASAPASPSLQTEPEPDPAQQRTIYEQKLLEATTKLHDVPFGRADTRDRNICPGEKWTDEIGNLYNCLRRYWDTDYWERQTKYLEGDKAEVWLSLRPGRQPSEAIDAIFKNLDKWHFDCAQSIQVAQWYAMRHAFGATKFNKTIREASDKFELKEHGSTGIWTQERYVRNIPDLPMQRILPDSNAPARNVDDLVAEIPAGSRITWTNDVAAENSDFRNENSIKLGPDSYWAHPFGMRNRAAIEFRLAMETYQPFNQLTDAERTKLLNDCDAGNPDPMLDKYRREHVFISVIEIFDITP